jgi:hypothetical protein
MHDIKPLLRKIPFALKVKNVIRPFIVEEPDHIKRSSSPFISGDSFKCLSNWIYEFDRANQNTPRLPGLEEIIFVQKDMVDFFLSNIQRHLNAVVIIHNGDSQETPHQLELLAKNCKFVFSTNLENNLEKINAIPIGIENSHYRKNGDLTYFQRISDKIFQKKDVCLTSFNVHTNPLKRLPIKDICLKNNSEFLYPVNLNKYRQKLGESYFVISPPGNGIDCHRTWEALYHKTIPVMERGSWLFDELDLPVLVVDSFQDFFNISLEKKLHLYQDLIKKSVHSAYLNYWLLKIFEKAKQ